MRFNREQITYIINEHETAGFKLKESLYPANSRMPEHFHDLASISFVLQGAYTETYGQKSRFRETSTIVFHPPQEKHAVNFENTKVHILNIAVGDERYRQISEYSSALSHPNSFQSDETAYLVNRIYQEFTKQDSFSSLAIEGLILEVLAASLRSGGHASKGTQQKASRWMKEVNDFLHENFSEPLTLEEIAAIAGVHSGHLSRVFRERFNCTVGEYLRKLRLEFARRQISASNLPLNEIALSAGFSDQSHLTRIFKSNLGVTPAAYRKLTRR